MEVTVLTKNKIHLQLGRISGQCRRAKSTTVGQRNRQKYRQTDRETKKHTNGQPDKHTDGQTDRQTDKPIDKPITTQTDRQMKEMWTGDAYGAFGKPSGGIRVNCLGIRSIQTKIKTHDVTP